MKKIAVVVIIGGVLLAAFFRVHHAQSPAVKGASTAQASVSDAASVWAVVNKKRPLSPKTYAPAKLVVPGIPLRTNITGDEEQVSAVMAPALEKMVAEAKAQGINLNLQSGYRSYKMQVSLYANYVDLQGQAVADTQSARPGYSEHQTGLAADLGTPDNPECDVRQCFANTAAGKWLAANAYKYGFIIRYPDGYEKITGYEYEPWHVRYVGTELAGKMHAQHIVTLEQYFKLPAAPAY